MKSIVALAGIVVAMLFFVSSHAVEAAGGPTIVITSPQSGAVITGSTVTMRVSVSNFKLVKPVLNNPPVLKGYTGNIEYIFDDSANFVPARDLSGSLTHTWTHVPSGQHTLIAVLATSQHVPWPGGKPATVTVMVQVPASTAGHAGGSSSPGVGAAPSTGGAADINHSRLNMSLLLAGILALILGVAFLTRRLTFGVVAGRRTERGIEAAMRFESLSDAPSQQVERVAPAEEGEEPELPVEAVGPNDAMGDGGIDRAVPAEDPAPVGVPLAQEQAPVEPETHASPSQPAPDVLAGETPRDRAVEMARQWNSVVEGLVRQIDEQEAERQRMLDHIRVLEEHLRTDQVLHEQLRDAAVSSEDFQAIRYVTDSLQRDPDHIVVLAAVAQHADKLQHLVESYAQLRRTLENS